MNSMWEGMTHCEDRWIPLPPEEVQGPWRSWRTHGSHGRLWSRQRTFPHKAQGFPREPILRRRLEVPWFRVWKTELHPEYNQSKASKPKHFHSPSFQLPGSECGRGGPGGRWERKGDVMDPGGPSSVQFSSVTQLCPTLCNSWTTARQAILSIAKSQNLLKLMSIESVMPSNHPILCRPVLLLPSKYPSIKVFSNESVLHISWPKY